MLVECLVLEETLIEVGSLQEGQLCKMKICSF